MPTSINLLDASLGIQNVMDMPETGSLPQARELPANALREAGLEDLYAPVNARQLMEKALCPDVGDGSILSPQTFSGLLRESMQKLEGSSNPAVKEMVSGELRPLLQNGELLQAYLGLMIGG